MKNKKHLRFPVYFNDDLTPDEAKLAKKLRDEAKKFREEGKTVKVRPNKITVDKQDCTFDFTSNSLVTSLWSGQVFDTHIISGDFNARLGDIGFLDISLLNSSALIGRVIGSLVKDMWVCPLVTKSDHLPITIELWTSHAPPNTNCLLSIKATSVGIRLTLSATNFTYTPLR
ncbi:hypothetical protein KQX54_012156 [Cotesia glomerata]|uniref:Endonuclease/exonuclease/phosphatase domain-containing protein n=1 Tax=Cotesia glomerata TaxID=32391 RepID=A0AAV7J023_COTGL|nr:hypothetical protein KQX54_012156 [Cotesia glomerata]